MRHLIAVTLLWAFSFSLIGEYLSGHVDNLFSVLTRVFLAFLVFVPFTQWRGLNARITLPLMAFGAIQLGVMYTFYYQSFLYLSVPEVLLFTIFTPIYVTLLNDIIRKQFSAHYLSSALIAVVGTAVIRWISPSDEFWAGFLVLQGANICFAIGQVGYKHLIANHPEAPPQRRLFGWFYLGALCYALPAFLLKGDMSQLPSTPTQWIVLVYLGTVASGVGYFVWNKGATKVNAGLLAIMNNALVPAGLVVNLLIWNKEADWLPFLIGSAIFVAALWWNER